MKRKIFTALLAGTLIISLSAVAFAGSSIKLFYNGQEIKTNTPPVNINSRIFAPVRALAPETSADAVNSWAEGVQTRNGAWQYAVMTPELKTKFYDDFVAMNWVTGTSSPWIKSFEVNDLGSLENTARYSVTFTWTDSTNSTSATTQYVTVKNIAGTWLVDSIKNLDLKGKITKVNVSGTNLIDSIFVEVSGTGSMYEQGTAILEEGTKIFKGNTSTELKASDLKVGTQVEVFYKEGPMILIYPPQAAAAEIRVF